MKKYFSVKASKNFRDSRKIVANDYLHEDEYLVMVCDNNSAASRGTEFDNFYEETWEFEQEDEESMPTDIHALIYACALTAGYEDALEFTEDYPNLQTKRDFIHFLESSDPGAGFPIVYAIKRKNGSFLFKSYLYKEMIERKRMQETGWDS